MGSVIEFRYEIEARPWKAAEKGRNTWFTPEPYASFREEFSAAVNCLCRDWDIRPEDRHKLDVEIVKKRKNGDRTNLLKAIEDCLQLSGLVLNDESIDDGNTKKRNTVKGEDPYIWFRLERIEDIKGKLK